MVYSLAYFFGLFMTGTVQSVGRAVHGSPGQFMHGPGPFMKRLFVMIGPEHIYNIYMPCHIRYEYSTGFISYIFSHGPEGVGPYYYYYKVTKADGNQLAKTLTIVQDMLLVASTFALCFFFFFLFDS